MLMIAPYFVPRRRVGAQRPFKFAIHLEKFGWKPTVITIADQNQDLSANEKRLLKEVEIIEVKPPFDRTTNQSSVKAVKQEENKKKGMADRLSDWIDKQVPMDTWFFFFLLNYRTIQKKSEELSPDIIWSTGDPWSGHWLGEKLSENLSVPWIADFRDPWTLSELSLRHRSAFSEKLDRKYESRFIKKADKLIFTSQQTSNIYKEHYKLSEYKTETIYNSFDPNLFPETKKTVWSADIDEKKFNIFFFGKFRRLSPIEPILQSVKKLEEMDAEKADNLLIHSFGIPDEDQLKLIREHNAEKYFDFHDPVLPELTIPVLKKADLLFLSTDPSRKNIIPAKLWDYLATGIPILSVAPNPEISDILSKSASGEQFDPDNLTGISNYIIELMADGKMAKKAVTSGVSDFTTESSAEKLALIMDDLTSDG